MHPAKTAKTALLLLFICRSVLIGFTASSRNAEEQHDQNANHRDQCQQLQPAGFADIMQTAAGDACCRQNTGSGFAVEAVIFGRDHGFNVFHNRFEIGSQAAVI